MLLQQVHLLGWFYLDVFVAVLSSAFTQVVHHGLSLFLLLPRLLMEERCHSWQGNVILLKYLGLGESRQWESK